MQPLVLLIDDDRLPMTYYIEALRQQKLDVQQMPGSDSALEFVRTQGDTIAAIVLDCMMPPGETYQDEDTDDGLLTGVFLFEDLRRECPGVPIVVLTNVNDRDILGRFGRSPLVKVVQKMEYPPLNLASLVKQMIKKAGCDSENAGP